ncbi:MAG: ATP-dependent DNA helicase RecG [bacterium]
MNFLDTPITSITRPHPETLLGLKKIGIQSVRDLLYYFPQRYGSVSSGTFIRDVKPRETVTLYGQVSKLATKKSFKSKVAMAEGTLSDSTGKIKLMWFHQPYIAKIIQEDSLVKVQGKISERAGNFAILNPEIESVAVIPDNIGDGLFGEGVKEGMNPVYAETRGVSTSWIYHTLQRIFKDKSYANIPDPIPDYLREKYNLPTIQTALIWIHGPKNNDDATVARKRFAFEEVLFIQLKNQQIRYELAKEKSFVIDTGSEGIEKFKNRFGFPLTDGQVGALADILNDIKSGSPMSRLLEGDVGSGKTAVAALASYATITTIPKNQKYGHLQVGYMAPTEILANQHFESFIKLFSHMPISIGLITGNGCKKFPSKVSPSGWTNISRPQFLKWVASGEISIVIGTHALIQKSVRFKNLALVIIDEQHRFGTAQRQKLTRKHDLVPHLLSMTATPIPRTLALTLYGDLDLSVLDQMPSGRKKIITELVTERNRKNVHEKVLDELKAGRQAYVICPRIEESDPDKVGALIAKSVKQEAFKLKKGIFKDYRIEIMHSKMKPADKEKIMKKFYAYEIDILVSTSVVEVGVNVPNANIILIEDGHRYGLAQLHQLRGRVVRGNHQPYCFVFTDSKSEKTSDRLDAFKTAKNGFELSELDLKLRGAGELYIGKQWGISDIAMEAIKNLKMVEAARKEAKEIIAKDPQLNKNPLLGEEVARREDVHFE